MQLQNFLLYIHLIALASALIGIVQADHMGFQWMRGKVQLLDGKKADQYHYLVSFSLAILIMTGIWLLWPMREILLQNPLFIIKLVFVSILVINAVAIENLMPVSTVMSFSQVPTSKKMLLLLSGAISSGCWFGAIALAYAIFGWLF